MENETPSKEKAKMVATDSHIIFNKNWKEVEFKHYENGKISVEVDEFERQSVMLDTEDFMELYNWLKAFCE